MSKEHDHDSESSLEASSLDHDVSQQNDDTSYSLRSSSSILLPGLDFSRNSSIKTLKIKQESQKFQKVNEMATLGTNQLVSLKDAMECVPEFDGKSVPLSDFVIGCEDALEMLPKEAEKNLVKLIRNKLKGEVRDSIHGNKFEKLSDFITFLKRIYSPNKSEMQLMGELGSIFQKETENTIAFAAKIKKKAKEILETRKLSGDGANNEEFQTSLKECCLTSFLNGLKPEIEQRLPFCATIEDAVDNAIKTERKIIAQRQLRSGSTENRHKKTHVEPVNTCTICAKNNHTADSCRLNNIHCQTCKKQGHTADRCYKNSNSQTSVMCQLCGKGNHTAKNCNLNPNKIKTTCQLCNLTGHSANQCSTISRFKNLSVQCQLCRQSGHTADRCNGNLNAAPKMGEQKQCRYCKNIGHNIEDCRKRKFNNTRTNQGNDQGTSRADARRGPPTTQERPVNVVTEASKSGDFLCS